MALEVTEANLDELINNNTLVLDFWAPWCGPCRMLGPIIDELSEDNKDGVMVGKVNVDENPNLAANYGIRGIPTVVLIKDGEVVDKLVGINPKSVYQEKIDSLK